MKNSAFCDDKMAFVTSMNNTVCEFCGSAFDMGDSAYIRSEVIFPTMYWVINHWVAVIPNLSSMPQPFANQDKGLDVSRHIACVTLVSGFQVLCLHIENGFKLDQVNYSLLATIS